MTVRTRFAPSPTGFLHIGGVRTALFNWLWARANNGQFVLRIDDTDQSREVADAIRLILDGFTWLGLDWDEGPNPDGSSTGPYGPYFQSQRGNLYEAAIQKLISTGNAYPCETAPAELDTMRAAAQAAKKPFVYRGKNRELSPDDALALYNDKKPMVRFKVPLGQKTVLKDHIRGDVEWDTDLLGDFSIARAGGGPLYNLATVVDDRAMKITHIIRAEEHLSNTHPQLLLHRALGGDGPEIHEFAHIPFVCAPGSKKKLSKRNPPPGVMVGLNEYEDAGYLPEALVNALARVGWSLDDHTEVMDLSTLLKNFTLDRITKAPASLDPDKFFWFQDQYMRKLDPAKRVEMMIPYLQKENLVSNPVTDDEKATVAKIDAACGDRLKLLSDIVRYSECFFLKEMNYDKKAAKVLKKEGTVDAIDHIVAALEKTDPFTTDTIEASIHQAAEQTGMGGKINHVLRAGTTGRAVGLGVYEAVEILGQDKALARLDVTKQHVQQESLPLAP